MFLRLLRLYVIYAAFLLWLIRYLGVYPYLFILFIASFMFPSRNPETGKIQYYILFFVHIVAPVVILWSHYFLFSLHVRGANRISRSLGETPILSSGLGMKFLYYFRKYKNTFTGELRPESPDLL